MPNKKGGATKTSSKNSKDITSSKLYSVGTDKCHESHIPKTLNHKRSLQQCKHTEISHFHRSVTSNLGNLQISGKQIT